VKEPDPDLVRQLESDIESSPISWWSVPAPWGLRCSTFCPRPWPRRATGQFKAELSRLYDTEIHQIGAERTALQAEVTALRTEAKSLREDNQALQVALDGLRGSTSFRCSAPARRVYHTLRRR